LVAVLGGGDAPAKLDVAWIAAAARDTQGHGADPFAYNPAFESQFQSRAAAGESHVLFAQSPGGVVETAKRVDAFRDQIDAATRGTDVEPDLLGALVFLGGAGRPQVSAGKEAGAAAGLTQIVGSTGTSLLGMDIDVERSHELTREIAAAARRDQPAKVKKL